MLSPGMPVSLSNYTDIIAQKLDKPGRFVVDVLVV